MDLKEFFLKQKQATYDGVVKVFAKVPPDQLGWKPAPSVLSLGEIVRHVWMSEEGMRRIALTGDWSYFEKRIPLGLKVILGEIWSLDGEMRQLARVHDDTLRDVRAFPTERWDEERVHEAFNYRRTATAVLYAINEHQIHHRAQVTTYLRILTGERASAYEH